MSLQPFALGLWFVLHRGFVVFEAVSSFNVSWPQSLSNPASVFGVLGLQHVSQLVGCPELLPLSSLPLLEEPARLCICSRVAGAVVFHRARLLSGD